MISQKGGFFFLALLTKSLEGVAIIVEGTVYRIAFFLGGGPFKLLKCLKKKKLLSTFLLSNVRYFLKTHLF